jgi:HSP20 family protein
MLAEAIERLQGADRLQRQFFRIGRTHDVPSWEPPVDIVGNNDELGVIVALPGVAPGRYGVTLEYAAIVVYGERSLTMEQSSGDIIRLEIPYGHFERRIGLPYGSYRMISMLLENGCLRLHLERIK